MIKALIRTVPSFNMWSMTITVQISDGNCTGMDEDGNKTNLMEEIVCMSEGMNEIYEILLVKQFLVTT